MPDLGPAPSPGLPPLSILMYHQVGEFDSPGTHRAGYCHVARFRAQMAYLAAFGYRVVSLDAALAGLFGGVPLAPKSVVLTFDDGYRNFLEHALPTLERHGFPAAVFMIAGLIGKTADWLGADGRATPPMLDAAELRELRAAGVTIGSHTVSHPRLSRIAPEAAVAEVRDSKARLEDVLGERIEHFCYPFGDYAPQVRDAVAEAGYRSGLTCIRGAANTADNAFELPRKAISYGDNLIGYFWKLHMKHARKDATQSY